MDWFFLSLLAFVGYGIQNFLFKVAAHRKLSSVRVNSVFLLTVTILAGVVYLPIMTQPKNLMLLLIVAVANGTVYLIVNIMKIQSLKKIPVTIFSPVAKMYVALTPVFALIAFRESLTGSHVLGISLAVIVVLALSIEGRKEKTDWKKIRSGLLIAGLVALLESFGNLLGKYAAMNVEIIQYIFFAYGYTFLLSLLVHSLAYRNKNPLRNIFEDKNSLKLGFLIGLLNFSSYFILLNGLSTGPASVIYPIVGLGLIVTVFLACLVYKEKLTANRIVALVLTAFAIFLLR